MNQPQPQTSRRKVFWSRPLFLIVAFGLVLVLSAASIIGLQRYSARQYSSAVQADELALTAYHLYTAAWRSTLSFQPQPLVPPEAIGQEQDEAADLFDLALTRYQAEAAEANSFDARQEIVVFGSQLETAHGLIDEGRYDEALGVMLGTNAAYYPMADAVYLASERYARNAARAETLATLSIAGVYVFAFAFIAAIFVIYRRAERKAEHSAAEQEILRRSEARFRPLVQSSSDLITVVDRDGVIQYASPAILRFTGRTAEEAIGASALDIVVEEDRRSLYGLISEVKNRPNYTTSAELHLPARSDSDGERFIQVVCTNRLNDPDVEGLVLNIRDVSERKALEEQLRHQAFHDSLTGLANRLRFTDRLEHALERGKRNGGKAVSVLYLDLDYFKNVNDDMGHSAGDTLLRAVAERIGNSIRSTDTAARLGGDEFAILLEDQHSPEDARSIAEAILAQMKQPFSINGREVYVSASIGVVIADPNEMGAEEIIRDADVAMYDAKENGRGRVQVFEASMQLSLAERAALTNDLNGAIERNELEVYYQPTLQLENERIAGFEALVRWNHPVRGLLGPTTFIPLAEESGFIHDLGRFVLFEACRQGKEWQSKYPDRGSFAISVNVSARQVQKPGFVWQVREVLRLTGFDPASLILEITESVLIRHPQDAIVTLEELKSLGLHLALDDFGTGYSSLSYLKRFPIDILKIDRTFIEGMDESDRDRMLVQTVIDLGHTLKLKIVAEGIERDAQLESLQKLDCALGQGFLFSKALDARSAEAMLRDQLTRPTLASSEEIAAHQDARVA